MTPLEKRHQATMLTVKKYLGKPFAWGGCDCAKVAAFHARKFGWKVPKTEAYRSATGAKKYLRKLGAETLPELLDQIGFEAIPPAMNLMGDFVSFAADDPLGGIGIAVGGGKIMAFHEDHPGLVMIDANWRMVARAWSVWREAARV